MTNNDTAGWPRQDEIDKLTDALTETGKQRDMWRQRAIKAGWWTAPMPADQDAPTEVLPAITPEVVELVRRECEKAVAAALAAREAGEVREVAIERTPYATVTQAVATALGDVRGELLASVQPGNAVSTADAAVRKVAVAWGVAL
jgi:hypothetical protein